MQTSFYPAGRLTSPRLLQKSTSLPSFTDTNNSSSSNSIDSSDDEHRQLAIRWLLSYNRKVTKDTQYLAIAYLHRLLRKSICLCEQNYEKVVIALLLLACKMNEIYPPKISAMLAKCRRPTTKEEIVQMEAHILTALDFDTALESTPYSLLHSILAASLSHKVEECEKLLRIVAPHREIYQQGDQILAYAVIYLIVPQFIRDLRLNSNNRVKTLAIKIYNLYTENKKKYEMQKENRGLA